MDLFSNCKKSAKFIQFSPELSLNSVYVISNDYNKTLYGRQSKFHINFRINVFVDFILKFGKKKR